MSEILLQSMAGLGDCIHERAVVRYYLEQGDRVWITTVWPQVFFDLSDQFPGKLKFIKTTSSLRTQAKNAARSEKLWTKDSMPGNVRTVRVSYSPERVREMGGVLQAMLYTAGVPQTFSDFRFVRSHVNQWVRAKMIYRPLVERTEWGGCNARNPDQWAYGTLAHSLVDRVDIISIADIEPGKEWIAGADIPALMKLHKGELSFEDLVDEFTAATLVFSSPGFAVPLAQALGTPVVVVFGGYEDARSFTAGAKFTPTLNIEPIKPCACFQHNHTCLQHKAIDYPAAKERLDDFFKDHCNARLLKARHHPAASDSPPRFSGEHPRAA